MSCWYLLLFHFFLFQHTHSLTMHTDEPRVQAQGSCVYNCVPSVKDNDLRRDLLDLLSTECMSDVNVIVENETIPAHKIILAARSRVSFSEKRDWNASLVGHFLIFIIKFKKIYIKIMIYFIIAV